MIQVQDGDRLTGHCVGGGDYPELLVYDGQGPGGGSLMFSMGSFHWCGVHITRNHKTELWFENKTSVTVSGGIVMYAPGDAMLSDDFCKAHGIEMRATPTA